MKPRIRRGRRELIEEALAAHEAFRRLGAKPEEIFFGVQQEGDPKKPSESKGLAAFVVVRRPSGFEFNYICGPVTDEKESDEIVEMWPKAVAEWNQPDMKSECDRIWRESNIANMAGALSVAWTRKIAEFLRRDA